MANVTLREVAGNYVLYDARGNEILTIDGVNRLVSFAPGSGLVAPLHVDLTDLAAEVTALTYLVAAIPAADQEDSETVWNDGRVLKVSSAGA